MEHSELFEMAQTGGSAWIPAAMEKKGLFNGVENTHAVLPLSARPLEVVKPIAKAPNSKLESAHSGVSKADMFANPAKAISGGAKRPALSELNNNYHGLSNHDFQPPSAAKGAPSLHLLQNLRPTGSALLTGAKRIVVFQSPPQKPVDAAPPTPVNPSQRVQEKNHYMKPTAAFKHAVEDPAVPTPVRVIKRGNYGKASSNQTSPTRARPSVKHQKEDAPSAPKAVHARNGTHPKHATSDVKQHQKVPLTPDTMRTPTRPTSATRQRPVTPPSNKVIVKEKEEKSVDPNVYNRLFNGATEVTKAREASRNNSVSRANLDGRKSPSVAAPQPSQPLNQHETHHNILFSPQSILKHSSSTSHLDDVPIEQPERPQSATKTRPKSLTFALQEKSKVPSGTDPSDKKECPHKQDSTKHDIAKRSPHIDPSKRSPLRRPIVEILTPKSTPGPAHNDDADSKASSHKKLSAQKKISTKAAAGSSQHQINANKLSANKAAKLACMAKMNARYAAPTVASHVRHKEQSTPKAPQPSNGNSRSGSAQRIRVQDHSNNNRSTPAGGAIVAPQPMARSPAHHFADEILRVVEACTNHSPMNNDGNQAHPFRDEEDDKETHRSLSPILMGDFENSSSKFINDGEDSLSLHFAIKSNNVSVSQLGSLSTTMMNSNGIASMASNGNYQSNQMRNQGHLKSIESDISTVASCVDDIHGVSLQNSIDPNFNIDDLQAEEEISTDDHQPIVRAGQPPQLQPHQQPLTTIQQNYQQQLRQNGPPAPQTTIISVSSRPPSRLRLDDDVFIDDISLVQPGTYSPHNLSNVSTFSTSEAPTPTMGLRPISPHEMNNSVHVNMNSMIVRLPSSSSAASSSANITKNGMPVSASSASMPNLVPPTPRRGSSNTASSTETLLSSLNPPSRAQRNLGAPGPAPTLRRQISEDSGWASDIYNMLEPNTRNMLVPPPPPTMQERSPDLRNRGSTIMSDQGYQQGDEASTTFNSELNNAILLSSSSMISLSTNQSAAPTPVPRTAQNPINIASAAISTTGESFENINISDMAQPSPGSVNSFQLLAQDISAIPHVGSMNSMMMMSTSIGNGTGLASLSSSNPNFSTRFPLSSLINPQSMNGSSGIAARQSLQLNQAFIASNDIDEFEKENFSPIATPTVAPTPRNFSPRKPLQSITEDFIGEHQSSPSSASGYGNDPLSITSADNRFVEVLDSDDPSGEMIQTPNECDISFIQSGSLSVSVSVVSQSGTGSVALRTSLAASGLKSTTQLTVTPASRNIQPEDASIQRVTSNSSPFEHHIDYEESTGGNQPSSTESSEPFVPHQDLNKSIEIEPRLSLPIPIPAVIKTPKRNNFLEIEERLSTGSHDRIAVNHGRETMMGTPVVHRTPTHTCSHLSPNNANRPPATFDFLSMDVSYTRIPPNHNYNPEERIYEGDEVRSLRELEATKGFEYEISEEKEEIVENEDDDQSENSFDQEGEYQEEDTYGDHDEYNLDTEDHEIYSDHSSHHMDEEDAMVQLQESEHDYIEYSNPSTIPFAESENDTMGNYAAYLKTLQSFTRPDGMDLPFNNDESNLNEDTFDDQYEGKDMIGPLNSLSIGQHFRGVEESTISESTNRSIASHTSSMDELQHINSRMVFNNLTSSMDPSVNEKPRHRAMHHREVMEEIVTSKPQLSHRLLNGSFKSTDSSVDHTPMSCPDPLAAVLNNNVEAMLPLRHEKTFKPLSSIDKLER